MPRSPAPQSPDPPVSPQPQTSPPASLASLSFGSPRPKYQRHMHHRRRVRQRRGENATDSWGLRGGPSLPLPHGLAVGPDKNSPGQSISGSPRPGRQMALLGPSLAQGDFPTQFPLLQGLVKQALRCQTVLPRHRISWHLPSRKGTGWGLGSGAGKDLSEGVSWRAGLQPLNPLPFWMLWARGPGSQGPSGARRGLMWERLR